MTDLLLRIILSGRELPTPIRDVSLTNSAFLTTCPGTWRGFKRIYGEPQAIIVSSKRTRRALAGQLDYFVLCRSPTIAPSVREPIDSRFCRCFDRESISVTVNVAYCGVI